MNSPQVSRIRFPSELGRILIKISAIVVLIVISCTNSDPPEKGTKVGRSNLASQEDSPQDGSKAIDIVKSANAKAVFKAWAAELEGEFDSIEASPEYKKASAKKSRNRTPAEIGADPELKPFLYVFFGRPHYQRITVDELISEWLGDEKGVFEVIGWTSESITPRTYLVSYLIERNGKKSGWYFEVSIPAKLVRYVNDDAELSKHYQIGQ